MLCEVKMRNLSPIILFVYNRSWHTEQTVDALKKNELVNESNLFIFSDGPKIENDENVKKVREYIKTIDGFKSVTIIEREKNLGLAHGMKSDSSFCCLNSKQERKTIFFEENKDKINDPYWQTLFLVRRKMMLLRYLLKVPENLGFETYSPFLDPEILFPMLNLSKDRRENRLWQKEFFIKKGLDMKSSSKDIDYNNCLNIYAQKEVMLKPLNEKVCCSLFDIKYIRWVNGNVVNKRNKMDYKLFIEILSLKLTSRLKFFSAIIRLVEDFSNKKIDDNKKAYGAYLTLKPLEEILRRIFG